MITVFNRTFSNPEFGASFEGLTPFNPTATDVYGGLRMISFNNNLRLDNSQYLNMSFWIKPEWLAAQTWPVTFFQHFSPYNGGGVPARHHFYFGYDFETGDDSFFVQLHQYEYNGEESQLYLRQEQHIVPVPGGASVLPSNPNGKSFSAATVADYVNIILTYDGTIGNQTIGAAGRLKIYWNGVEMQGMLTEEAYGPVGSIANDPQGTVDLSGFIWGGQGGVWPTGSNPYAYIGAIDYNLEHGVSTGSIYSSSHKLDKFIFDNGTFSGLWGSNEINFIYANGSPGTYIPNPNGSLYLDFSDYPNWYDDSFDNLTLYPNALSPIVQYITGANGTIAQQTTDYVP